MHNSSNNPKSDTELELAEDVGLLSFDPQGFAVYAYPWGEGELAGMTGPRDWQAEINEIIRAHLENPDTRFMPLMIAVASGHGIGKSAEIGMLVNWAMSTCEHCKVVVTANTFTQLQTKTWPEVLKWARLSITGHWFNLLATSMASVEEGADKTWRADSIAWSVQNTEAFAGLHNVRKRIVVIFDEASGIHNKIWEVVMGALTDEETEIIWIAFGNPTRNTGAFRDCFKGGSGWVVKQIDSRTVEGTNKKLLDSWAKKYGENSDFMKVRVKGQFPAMGAKQFISVTDADSGLKKVLRPEQYSFAPKIISVDPAWTGGDEFVIGLRQGLHFQVLRVLEKNDDDSTAAALIASLEDEHKADAVFIDAGFGTGIVSCGKILKRFHWRLVWFGSAALNPAYLNKRTEMWNAIKEWLKEGGSIGDDQLLYDELITPELKIKDDGKIALESKDDMKERGERSPNRADCLAISFAYPVMPRAQGLGAGEANMTDSTWKPFGAS